MFLMFYILWCFDTLGPCGTATPRVSWLLEIANNLPWAHLWYATHPFLNSHHHSSSFYQALTARQHLPAWNHPRAKYQTTRTTSIAQSPLKLFKLSNLKPTQLLTLLHPFLPAKKKKKNQHNNNTIKAFAHISPCSLYLLANPGASSM